MKKEEEVEIDRYVDSKINLIERVTRLEVKVEKLENFNNAVILVIALGIIGWVAVQILQKYLV